ncbi:deoxyribonuclease V [Rhodothermus profundi]|uniref:Endonuclease V n=1 Tax=Rhodothermus profundi TaxID=633813 RepID=A0A1M6QGJ5_9BACT|nr:deoxyribonuclease V [Rhodothermus profundi]SHK19346.1 Endonuclease V [Rhodothermus profundi]
MGLIPRVSHPWNLSPKEARALQRQLARQVRFEVPDRMETVAGLDVSVRGERGRAAVVVWQVASQQVLECVVVEGPVAFPYIPGLLSFREVPLLLQALARLRIRPDVLMVDGQGWAHPRRCGLATHLGVLLDHPSVGVAKSRLTGHHDEPGVEKGSWTLLYDNGEVIGAVVRTRTGVRPVYVSVGHRMTLEAAVALTLRCTTRFRLPEPTRRADQLSRKSFG